MTAGRCTDGGRATGTGVAFPDAARRGTGAEAQPQPAQSPNDGPENGLLDGRIGVIWVGMHVGANRTSYVDSLHARIAALDSDGDGPGAPMRRAAKWLRRQPACAGRQ